MSSGLITLHLTATSTVSGTITTTTTTTITPLVKRFTATVVIGNILSGVTTIPSTSFKDDSGANLPANGLTVPGSNGYYNVFVNGTLIAGGLTTLTTASLAINNALTIGVTVVLETLSFTATSSSTSTTNNLVVTTLIHSI
ncbi:DUF4183 domain-containing protein [Paenibacillus sp. CGMCC 1.16610]|uniref:DUF4183 domain-containing protein n=1 Tax=Paenibacillus anseongense TaxID=2682845 RepID=A0ABW9UCK8_9BACL|nr:MULTISPECIES: DUF4183 domain-containing protein [Paenibacillus]MBA2943950.1 DUF4183 domain-containing protein [Paenibacillus sp. CGMCC 1.16610]MVQ37839.1 DUF4183 domain-containing protein [Paenibacillus anseongense]